MAPTLAIVDWMAWTTGTVVLVCAVLGGLATLAAFAVNHPPQPRKGFLPIETSGGDRLYISLLGAGLIMILWVAYTDQPLPFGLLLSLAWMGLVIWRG